MKVEARARHVAEVPKHYHDIKNSPEKEKWYKAYFDEIQSLEQVGKLRVMKRPEDQEVLPVLELFTKKFDNVTHAHKYKARIVVRGDLEKQKAQEKHFSPVANYDSIRLVFGVCAIKGFKIRQLDIKTAYLYASRESEVYLELPQGHVDRIGNQRVWVTKTSVYGLRDAPSLWNHKINEVFKKYGLQRCYYETCLYKKKDFYVLLYVADVIFMGKRESDLDEFQKYLQEKFKLKTTDVVEQFIGFERLEENTKTKLPCSKYIEKLVEDFELTEARGKDVPIQHGRVLYDPDSKRLNDVGIYQSLIGSLLYLTMVCRPDITYIVNYLSRFNKEPRMNLLEIAKGVLIYLRGTKDFGLQYEKKDSFVLEAYVDSDWGSERLDRKSVSGYVILLNGTPISYKAKKQSGVAQSTAEAEFVS